MHSILLLFLIDNDLLASSIKSNILRDITRLALLFSVDYNCIDIILDYGKSSLIIFLHAITSNYISTSNENRLNLNRIDNQLMKERVNMSVLHLVVNQNFVFFSIKIVYITRKPENNTYAKSCKIK